MLHRSQFQHPFTITIGGAPQSRKAQLLLALCRLLRDGYSLAVVTHDVPTNHDSSGDFLIRHKALSSARISVITGGGDVPAAFDGLIDRFRPELLFVEADERDPVWTRAISDYSIHVVDASSNGIPEQEWQDVSESDLLVINKTQIGPPLDPSRNPVVQDSVRLRDGGRIVFAQTRHGLGVLDVAKHFLGEWRQATAPPVLRGTLRDSQQLLRVAT